MDSEWVSGRGRLFGRLFKKVGKAQKVFTSPSTHNDGGCAGGAKMGCTIALVFVGVGGWL